MPWRGIGPDISPDFILKFICKFKFLGHFNKENDSDVIVPGLPYNNRVFKFFHSIQPAVDFRRADSDTTRIESGIGSAEPDYTTMFSDHDKVTMCPDSRVLIKVGRMIFGAVFIPPEKDGHRRKRCSTDKFCLLSHYGFAAFIIGIDLHA